MIYSVVYIPCSEFLSPREEDLAALFNFVATASLASTIVLRLTGTSEVFIEGKAGHLASMLAQVQQVSPCHIEGIPLPGLILDQEVVELFVVTLLDSGALAASFDCRVDTVPAELKSFLSLFPRMRTGLRLVEDAEEARIAAIFHEYKDAASIMSFRVPASSLSTVTERCKALTTSGGRYLHMVFDAADLTDVASIASFATIHENIHITIASKLLSSSSSFDEIYVSPYPQEHGRPTVDLIGAFIACLRSDRPDGLFTSVVCDELNVCLGLVYSNAESIRAAIAERRGIYWSRSRGGLWRKGDTSGMHQDLLALKYDCDRDALRFTVIQNGDPAAFCHLLTRSCWGPEAGLQKLESTLRDRKRDAPPGSYTKKLFDDPSMLRKKLLEEVQELVEAEEPDHVAAEAADVLYFVMTRCVAAGVGLRDIDRHLEKRSAKVTRRPGLPKDWRTTDAENILNAPK